MKRSEMVDKISELIYHNYDVLKQAEESGIGIEAHTPLIASLILYYQEQEGMLPPLSTKVEQENPTLDGEYGGIVLENKWENENEEIP